MVELHRVLEHNAICRKPINLDYYAESDVSFHSLRGALRPRIINTPSLLQASIDCQLSQPQGDILVLMNFIGLFTNIKNWHEPIS